MEQSSRSQFTFYKSYFEAIEELPDDVFVPVLKAICRYALFNEEPALSGIAKSVFILIRPTLDTGRNKSNNRKNKMKENDKNQASTQEQTKNKPETNKEQRHNALNQSNKEKEVEREVEVEIEAEREIENDSYIYSSTPPTPSPPPPKQPESKPESRVLFEQLWNLYPENRRGNQAAAWSAYRNAIRDKPSALEAIDNLRLWSQSEQWSKSGGQYIPYMENWLSRCIWCTKPAKMSIPYGGRRELDEDDLEAIRRIMAQPLEPLDDSLFEDLGE